MPPGVNDRYPHFDEAIKRLKKIKKDHSLQEIKEDVDLRSILERMFEKSVMALVDVANYLITEKEMEKPRYYTDTFDILSKAGIIDEKNTDIFKDFVKERNKITHEYSTIDYEKIYRLLDHLDKLVECMEKILLQLDTTEI